METDVAESAFYQYNESNQLVSAKLFDGKKNTTVTYIYDENGNHVFQLNDNLHTDEDWKGNNGNGNRKTVSPGESNFYLYDPAGNVAGITDQDGYLWQSYWYDAFGNAGFGSPQYDMESRLRMAVHLLKRMGWRNRWKMQNRRRKIKNVRIYLLLLSK